MENIECSKTLEFKLQMLWNNPKEKNTTFKTGRKFEIKTISFYISLILLVGIVAKVH
jgi:hypothetical protein